MTTDAAEAVAEAARSTVASLALEIPGAAEGEEPLAFSPETIASWLSFGPDYGEAYAIHVDEAAAAAAVAGLVESVDQEPVNAQITVAAGGGLGGVIAGSGWSRARRRGHPAGPAGRPRGAGQAAPPSDHWPWPST